MSGYLPSYTPLRYDRASFQFSNVGYEFKAVWLHSWTGRAGEYCSLPSPIKSPVWYQTKVIGDGCQTIHSRKPSNVCLLVISKVPWSVIGLCLAISPKKEASNFNGWRLSLWLKSGDFVPKCYLAGVRGSRTHLPRSSRGITDLKSARATGPHPLPFTRVVSQTKDAA